MDESFCVFILTHGRPDRVITYKTLKSQGYTGLIYIIIDNEDIMADQYYANFGDKVIMFDKEAVATTFDEGDNFNDRRAIVYARNASFEIAKQRGVKYFLQLDDDYTSFYYKFDSEYYFVTNDPKIKNLDMVFGYVLDFLKNTPMASIAFAQSGDFIGGREGHEAQLKRKCMNTFFCKTDAPVKFSGRVNEDVVTYVSEGSRGSLFFTVTNIAIHQKPTQSQAGGMTGLYLTGGTYIKSFYPVLFAPSCVKITLLHTAHPRLHHKISWKNAVPVIIHEKYKKLK